MVSSVGCTAAQKAARFLCRVIADGCQSYSVIRRSGPGDANEEDMACPALSSSRARL
ncbi:hypothetical protein [Haematospirillum jordaniae]|uniref:hypothetical protein n=1 Tax=Haematospirillum jordaniae TaxID=1549855 RepID=UPI001432D0BF|nr:hypothetical protein [Haematospirillum jordaniae]NKD92728.1 hypothetical protein [Haematospirillum jordaniae]